MPFRYAGDEFTVFCHAGLDAAAEVAERVRVAVAAADFNVIAPGVPVSVSIGVATPAPGMSAAERFQAADANLYHAEREGRNRAATGEAG
jgi:diguanylate cyclase (GGDEF)-like protein